MSSDAVRWGALGAVLAGVAFVVLSFLSLGISGPSPYFDAGFGVAWLFAIPGLLGLHGAQKERYGLLGRVGSVALVAGVIANTVGLVPLAVENESLLWLSFPVGALLLLVGFLALGGRAEARKKTQGINAARLGSAIRCLSVHHN